MRREKKKGYDWKNIVPIMMGGFRSGANTVTKRFMTKDDAKRYRKESSVNLFVLLAIILLGIGIPLIVGYLINP